jgi:hypothetical protein
MNVNRFDDKTRKSLDIRLDMFLNGPCHFRNNHTIIDDRKYRYRHKTVIVLMEDDTNTLPFMYDSSDSLRAPPQTV